MEIEAWTGLGGLLGEALGAIWAPKAVWHRKKEADDQKMTASGLPFWGPFATCSFMFNVFSVFFASLHFLPGLFFMDFDQLFKYFL